MATKLKIERVGDEIVWMDRVSGRQVFAFAPATVADALRDRVFDYGVKQILSDAAAGSKSERETVVAMGQRATALRNGTWGQRQSRLPDADVFGALVAIGTFDVGGQTVRFVNSDASREKWTALKPAERRALGRLPEVVEWLEAHGDDEPDADDLLSMFKS